MEHHPEPCGDVRNALPLYVGADLEASEQAEVREHLAACPACRSEAARAQEARDLLRGLRRAQDLEPAPDLWPGVRAALRGRARRVEVPAAVHPAPAPRRAAPRAERPARRGPRSLRWGLGSAAAAAAVVLVTWMGGAFGPSPESTPGGTGPALADGLGAPAGTPAPGGTVLRTAPASSASAPGAPQDAVIASPAVARTEGEGTGRLRRASADEPHMLDAAHEVLVVLPALPAPGDENVLTGDH